MLRAFRTSPVESRYANEAPANIRSNKLATQYYAKLKSCASNPAYNATFHPRYGELFEKREKAIKPYGLRMKSMLQQSKISVKNIHQDTLPKTPPWILEKPEVILKLNEPPPKKKPIPAHILKNFIQLYHTTLNIYTSSQMARGTTVEQHVQLS